MDIKQDSVGEQIVKILSELTYPGTTTRVYQQVTLEKERTMEKFLLSHTPTTEHRVSIIGDAPGRRAAVLVQQTTFELDIAAVDMLTWFLQAVKADKTVRHTYTEEHWILEYEPIYGAADLEAMRITRRATGRTVSMALSTAYKLLDALTGKTERLVKDEEE